jgi:hypothetical protein
LIIKTSGNPVNSVGVGIIPVKAQLVKDIGKYQQATGQPYGQSGQVDEGNEFKLHQVAQRNFKVVTKHGHTFGSALKGMSPL